MKKPYETPVAQNVLTVLFKEFEQKYSTWTNTATARRHGSVKQKSLCQAQTVSVLVAQEGLRGPRDNTITIALGRLS